MCEFIFFFLYLFIFGLPYRYPQRLSGDCWSVAIQYAKIANVWKTTQQSNHKWSQFKDHWSNSISFFFMLFSRHYMKHCYFWSIGCVLILIQPTWNSYLMHIVGQVLLLSLISSISFYWKAKKVFHGETRYNVAYIYIGIFLTL